MADPYHKRPAKYAERPRRVRGGRRLAPKNWPERIGPIAEAFLDAVEPNASPDAWAEGMEYAIKGQTRAIDAEPGMIKAAVQGRQYRAYPTILRVETFVPAQWEKIIETLTGQALHAAKLLSGEVPENIDEALGTLGVTLVARDPHAYVGECRGSFQRPWGKHLCCVALLTADMLDKDPMLAFTLRGVTGEDVVERIKQCREIGGMAGGGESPRARVPVRAMIPGSDLPVRPLEQCTDDFWDAGAELDLVETTVRRPEVNKGLLRRLGPSPFEGAKFPLVGLLATCYEVISNAALREASEGDDRDSHGKEPDGA